MGASRSLAVSAIQITAIDGERDRNVEKVLRLVDEAGARGSRLCVLPEMWTGIEYSSVDD